MKSKLKSENNYKDNKDTNLSERRILLFRCLTVLSLISTGVLCATFGYILLQRSEENFYVNQYDSLVNGVYQSVTEGVRSRIAAEESIASVFGGFCPKSENWPNCWVPYKTFDSVTNSLSESLNMVLTGMMPIIKPEELKSFEEFANKSYSSESYPAETGTLTGSFGVFAINRTTGHFYHDVTGVTPNSKYNYLIPFFEYQKQHYFMLMYNTHASQSHSESQDRLITCFQDGEKNCTSTVTDIVDVETNDGVDPSTGVFYAITPANNQSDLVGFISMYMIWEDILNVGAPSVLTDIYVVLDSGNSQRTYHFHQKKVTYHGHGDLHDTKFNDMKRSFTLQLSGHDSNYYNYTLTFYPSHDFYSEYHTNKPIYVCVTALLIVLVTSLIFMLYDFFVKREALEQTRILEAKQTYVRFISHEIRTPLNIVCLGMQAMRSDLGTITETVKSNCELTSQEKSDLIEKLVEADVLVEDVMESSTAAVLVLNDLINYDKIENKTLVIEAKRVSPISLITSTIRTLQVQAKQANVKLLLLSNFKDESNELSEVLKRDMCIIGDNMKLSQVIRNVVSNALKFSATGETVSVKVSYNPEGLKSIELHHLSDFIPQEFLYLLNFPRCGSLLIDIEDHGPGMGEEELSRLFQEGVQFNPNQLQAGQGSGLGLWISKGIIELHMGRLTARSEGLGLGSIFTIEIPLIETLQSHDIQSNINSNKIESNVNVNMNIPDTNQITQYNSRGYDLSKFEEDVYTMETTPHSSVNSARTEYHTIDTKDDIESQIEMTHEEIEQTTKNFQLNKILIVDDTPTNRKIVRRILKIDGYTDVDEAKDGVECIEMVSSHPPNEPWYDLILMDYEMPRMNGPSATSRLRELGYTMPIIGVTGNILNSDVTYFIQSGADSVLPKPVVMKDLYESYFNALKSSRFT